MSDASLVFFAYISRMNCPRSEIDQIISISRHRNAALKMSGALVHDDSHFLQFLEGPPASAADTILRILSDRRHDDVRILISERTSVRLFTNWHMKRLRPTHDDQALVEHALRFLDVPHAERGLSLSRFALALGSDVSTDGTDQGD